MEKRFYPLRFDYVFKRVFGDQRNIHILAAFLRAALDLDEADCDHLTIIDPHLKREFSEDKMGILDVKVRHLSGTITNVEIQVKVEQNLRKRAAFTVAKLLAEQLKRGDAYQQAQRVVSIVICGESLLFEESGYYNRYKLHNVRSGGELTDLLEIIILEPSKLSAEAEDGILAKWVRFFKAETEEELAMAGQTDPAIQEAVELVMEVNEDEVEWARTDSRWKWQMDQAARERNRYNEGLEKGLAEGRKEAEAAYQVIEEMKWKLREAGIDPGIQKAVGLVMEVNEDEVERARADSRWKWQMDQAARERNRYNEGLEKGRMEGLVEGRKEAEAAYQVIEEKARKIEGLKRKLREAGIDDR